MIPKGSYVEIMQIVLTDEERAKNIPDDTRSTPLVLWAKGWLVEESNIGKTTKISTAAGRIIEGQITEFNPGYIYDFGNIIPETLHIGIQAKSLLWGDSDE